jgi:hypothetical protein
MLLPKCPYIIRLTSSLLQFHLVPLLVYILHAVVSDPLTADERVAEHIEVREDGWIFFENGGHGDEAQDIGERYSYCISKS